MPLIISVFLILFSVVIAGATDLKVVPKKRSSAPPPVVASSCMDDIRAKCVGTHITKTFTKVCIRRNAYRCRR